MRKFALLALGASMLAGPVQAGTLSLTSTQIFSTAYVDGAAEIPAYDKRFNRLFVSAPGALKYFNATTGATLGTLNYSQHFAGSPNSVAVKGTKLAVAVEATDKTNAGRVLVYDTRDLTKAPQIFTVGSLPDQVTFSPDGTKILVANEGEPNSYGKVSSVDPVGSVSIIDLATKTVSTADFGSFNSKKSDLQAAGVRIYGPGASVAQDLEPEYIAVSPDGTKAYVTLQENNAIAIIDIASATVTGIKALGFKNMASGFDLNDNNGAYAVTNRSTGGTYGMYQPDAIASFTSNSKTYYVIANEGDAREYDNVGGAGINSELARAGATVANGGYALSSPLNRINVVRPGLLGVTNISNAANGANSNIFMNGGRSFSILDDTGAIVYDSGNFLERTVATLFSTNFADGRSDDKGPEPEEVKIGIMNGRTIAFIGLERANASTAGLVLAFDITDFGSGVDPVYLGGISSTALARPEGLTFFRRGENYFLAAADEQSNNVVLFQVGLAGLPVPAPASLALFGLGAGALLAARRRRAA